MVSCSISSTHPIQTKFVMSCHSGILEGADLDTLSSKKVRQQLEEKLKIDLTER